MTVNVEAMRAISVGHVPNVSLIVRVVGVTAAALATAPIFVIDQWGHHAVFDLR